MALGKHALPRALRIQFLPSARGRQLQQDPAPTGHPAPGWPSRLQDGVQMPSIK